MKRSPRYILPALFLSAVGCRVLKALELGNIDLSLKAGFVTGSLSSPSSNGGYTYAGFPMLIGYNLDLTPKVSVAAELGFVFDPANTEITRSGFDLIGSYHLWGGSRRVIHQYGAIEVAASNPYDLSLAVRTGFEHYGATSGTASATGSVIETSLGFQYRQDVSEKSAITVEVYTSVLSLSGSIERLTSSLLMTLLSWRFYL